ncbi:MAG: threonine/serine exporter family protein [Oscillospiraceae bacterium]|nr:threonine/serine exporter family protein [Oscillospiraceae bacterium]
MKEALLQIFMGAIGSMGFAILFNIRGKRFITATLGAVLSWGSYLLFSRFIGDNTVCYFLASVLTSFYAEIMARVLKTPTTTFIITSLIPLVPGSSLYYTMAYAFESAQGKFVARAAETLKLSSALALGVIVATTFTKVLMTHLAKKAQQKKEKAVIS